MKRHRVPLLIPVNCPPLAIPREEKVLRCRNPFFWDYSRSPGSAVTPFCLEFIRENPSSFGALLHSSCRYICAVIPKPLFVWESLILPGKEEILWRHSPCLFGYLLRSLGIRRYHGSSSIRKPISDFEPLRKTSVVSD